MFCDFEGEKRKTINFFGKGFVYFTLILVFCFIFNLRTALND